MRVQSSRLSILSAACGALLAGCAQSPETFPRADASWVSGEHSAAVLLVDANGNFQTDAGNTNHPALVRLREDAEFMARMKSDCTVAARTTGVPAGVVAGAIGKVLVDRYLERQIRATDALKRAAQATYSALAAFEQAATLKDKTCLVFTRYDARRPQAGGLTALFALHQLPAGDALRVAPRYIRAHDAVAITKSDPGAESVRLTIAIAVKTIVRKGGTNELAQIGSAVLPTRDVKIGTAGVPLSCPGEPCQWSDLIALPDAARPVSITIAVTETGRIDLDLDRELAELKALKEALGPAVRDALKE